jgi:hypothetical protein
MVDRASYPFGGSNLGCPSGIQWPRADGDEAAVAIGGAARERGGEVTVESLE